MRALAIAALLLASVPAMAAPKGKAAKAAFDRGVAAYTKGDFAGAFDLYTFATGSTVAGGTPPRHTPPPPSHAANTRG